MDAIRPSNPCPGKIHKSEKGRAMQFHTKCGWNQLDLMKYCRRENRVRIQMSTWIWTWERWARCPISLLRWEVPRQYGNSLWPGIQHGTHAQGVMDAVCSSYCSVQIHLLIGPWGTYELGWDFGLSFSLSLFLHRAFPQPLSNTLLYCAAQGSLVLFFSSFTNSSDTEKVRDDTAPVMVAGHTEGLYQQQQRPMARQCHPRSIER